MVILYRGDKARGTNGPNLGFYSYWTPDRGVAIGHRDWGAKKFRIESDRRLYRLVLDEWPVVLDLRGDPRTNPKFGEVDQDYGRNFCREYYLYRTGSPRLHDEIRLLGLVAGSPQRRLSPPQHATDTPLSRERPSVFAHVDARPSGKDRWEWIIFDDRDCYGQIDTESWVYIGGGELPAREEG